MRRKDREKDATFAIEVLRDCEYATLSTINSDGTPYCVPISPVVIDNSVYFHSATEGKKLDNIEKNNSVCLSGVRHTKLVPEKFTTEFESAVALGRCRLIENTEEKISALRAICEKYANSNMASFEEAITHSLERTAVYKINLEQITGKAKIY